MGSMLVVPFGRRRLLGVVVDVADESELPLERLAEPIAALEADVPQSLVTLGLWVAREYVSTPARGLALVLPPGTGTGAGRPLRPKRSLRAAITPAGEAALSDGARMGARQKGGARGARERAAGRRRTGSAHRLLARHPAQPGTARAAAARERRRCAPPPALGAGGGADGQRGAHGRPGGGVRADRVPPRAGATPASAVRCCCTGSPAAARQRCTCARWPPRSSAASSAVVLVPEIALTPQTAGASSSATASRWR